MLDRTKAAFRDNPLRRLRGVTTSHNLLLGALRCAHDTAHVHREHITHCAQSNTHTADLSTGRAAVHISHNTIMVHLSNFPPCSSCSRQNTENYICKEDSTAQRTGSSSGLDERRKSRCDWLSRQQRRPSSVVVFFLLLFLLLFFFFCFGGLEVVLLPSAGSL